MFDGPAHIVTVAMMCDWTIAVLGEGPARGQLQIGGFQSCDCDDARNSDGGQEVKSAMDEMEESPYCATLATITREIYI